MSSKFGFSSRYENLAKELIHHILGLKDEGDENFTASMDFVMSNLLYHHYLDVNSHTVQRSLEGVSFKMVVHGHQKKAEQLQTLINKFLSLPDFEEKGDLKWSILSLLNELSQHPARDSLTASFATDVDEDLESSKAETVTDWVDDLMEKSFQFPDKDDTLSEWSDDDDTLRQSYCSGIEPQQQRQPKQEQLKEKKSSEEFHLKAPTTPIKERERRNALLKAVQDSKSWFANSIQKPYWIVNKSEFCAPRSDNNIELTEYVVMRECIWLLLHPSSGFLFRLEGDKFIVAEPVVLSTLGKSDLKAILESFALPASKLYAIDKWLKDIETLVLNDPISCHKYLGGTLLSYADGLRAWRSEHFDDVLNQLEQTIFAQEGCQTLLWLLEELRTPFSTLETIHSVHSKAFSSPKDHRLFKSLRLLSLLIQGVEGGMKTSDQICLLVLFKSSIKSYLKTIHSLLWGVGSPSAAALEDFGIVKNSEEDDGTIKKYILQDLPIFCLPGLSFLNTLRQILMEICELREIVPNLNFEEDECSDIFDKLVEDSIHSVYFENDKKFQNRTSKINNNNDNDSNICNENSCNGVTSTLKSDKIMSISERNNYKCNSDLEGFLESVCEKDYVWETSETNSFLTKAFSLDQFECDSQETLLQHTSKKGFNKENFKDCRSLDHLLKNTLLPVIQNRHAIMSRFLLETLAKTYGLRLQLKVLVSAVLLDSSCAAMQEFYSNLFRKMDSKECLDEGDLTQNLQFCLKIAYPDVAPYFNVVFPQHLKSMKPSGAFSTEEVLSSLSLDFSDLWPLNIMLKKSHIIKYTKIFQFCLMLRRASFTIERLHFKEIGSHFSFEDKEYSLNSSLIEFDRIPEDCDEGKDRSLPLAHRIHRLQLLRQWVIYFVRVLRDHFSSAVFVPFSAKIEELLDKSNFSDFKQEHEVLLSKTFYDCLLDKETLSPIQTTLMQLFLTVERIHDLWVGPPHGITDAELDLLEEKYSSCHRLVANFLSALASVKFCPLVDGLAQCLTHNCPA